MMSPNHPTGTVTFLFTDVEGSTRRWEASPDGMRKDMAQHDAIVRTAIERHDGFIFTTAGDQFCAAFTTPAQALDAAVGSQTELRTAEWSDVGDLRVRMALHTGNADERDGDYFGPPLNRCARILSLGHGGQVLVSAATAELLRDVLPAGAHLVDLGPHVLKDFERREHVFQLVATGLPEEFPQLDSSSSPLEEAEQLSLGRQAHAASEWEEAYRALTTAADALDLDAEDLDRLGDAAFWTGRTDEAVTVRERAYASYEREGKTDRAALMALALAEAYAYRLASAVSRAWVARAERLVGDEGGTEAYGYLTRWHAVAAFEYDGDAERGLALAQEVLQIGEDLDDRNLTALGLQDKGRFLVALGRVDEGMALIDEAMIAAVAGETSPMVTGRSYCNMLAVCDQVADYQRASEWSDAAESWCHQHSDSAYPGVCRIFRAELKGLKGDWEAANTDLERAMSELQGFVPIIGAALVQKGTWAVRAGNLDEAEELFRDAYGRGASPLPGLAELRLRQGRVAEAIGLIEDRLAANDRPLDRARLLPTYIEARLAAGETERAIEAADELAATASLCHSAAMAAEAAAGRASIAAASGDPAAAAQHARNAVDEWTRLQMPYEASLARLVLADALYARGNDASATLEREVAQAALKTLGADVDDVQVSG